MITDSISGMADGSGLSTNFLSLVLLPLAGNAVEHITAVMVAIKNKMDLALAIAIGSSIQIAIFVLPTCVLFAWSIGNRFSLQLDALGAQPPDPNTATTLLLSPHIPF
jgi:Ca2+:H+ antiporter